VLLCRCSRRPCARSLKVRGRPPPPALRNVRIKSMRLPRPPSCPSIARSATAEALATADVPFCGKTVSEPRKTHQNTPKHGKTRFAFICEKAFNRPGLARKSSPAGTNHWPLSPYPLAPFVLALGRDLRIVCRKRNFLQRPGCFNHKPLWKKKSWIGHSQGTACCKMYSSGTYGCMTERRWQTRPPSTARCTTIKKQVNI